MKENELTGIIIGICIEIHSNLGPGLLESVYEKILAYELKERGIPFERQKPVVVIWKGQKMDIGFRPDLIVDNKIVIELKSVEHMTPVFSKILLTYLKLCNLPIGLLINFNVLSLKDGLTRIVNNF